ncbi:MAG: helix-turn-helix domain-containing protein [Candidatus Hodarchaeales archaeon]|jgi:predicted DNA-binding transcriptional regulator
MQQQDPELMQGKTMKIYWYLLTHGESGIRELKRKLNISSTSTVSYNINKLVNAGLVSKTDTEKYMVEETIQSGILGLYVKIGTYMIPRILFYFSFLAVGLILYLFIVSSRSVTTLYLEDFLFFFFSLSVMLFFGYEAYRVWTMKPF